MRRLIIIISSILLFASFTPTTTSYASNSSQVDVVILFNESIDEDLIEQISGTITNRYESIQAVSAIILESAIPFLIRDSKVKSIHYDQVVKADGQIVDWGIKTTQANAAHKAGFTGKGVKVAILDTGIDTNHPDLMVAGGICVLASCPNSYNDDNGHGTHVAGIISAINNTIGTLGAAPDANIFAVKVLDNKGYGTTSTILAGIEWAIKNKMDIINLSLSTPDNNNAMKSMIDQAYKQGILVVAAAGNTGTSNGLDDTVEYPARYESVIGVGNINSSRNRVSSSATGSLLEIVAPGESIYSTVPLAVDNDGQADGYTWMTGTSMAAPFVSGILAIYKQEFPNRTNIELRQMLRDNAVDLGNPGHDTFFGHGLVQVHVTAANSIEFPSRLVSATNGIIKIDVGPQPDNVSSYNVYRNGVRIKTNQTDLTVTEYAIKGEYTYQFSQNKKDGTKSGLSNPLMVKVTNPDFSDFTTMSWYTAPLVYLISESIVTGVGNGLIQPERLVTRSEAVTMIGRALGLNGTLRDTVFPDVNIESYASGFIQSAFEQKVITGYPDGTLRPNQPVTRAEMAIIIARAFKFSQIAPSSFSDVNVRIPGHEEIGKILYQNITKGYPDGTFRPYSYMTRAEFSTFLARAIKEEFR